MAYIEQDKLIIEFLNFLRNSDIFTTTQRSVTTTSESFTTTLTGAQTFTLSKTNTKNIRSVTYDSTVLVYGKDYSINSDDYKVTINSVVPAKNVVISFDYGADKIWPDYPRCFSDSAEILTLDGFKKINKISIKDKVMTYNLETGFYEYQPIIDYIEQDYYGEMIRIKNQQIDTLVTPNHKFVVRDGNYLHTKKPFLKEAKHIKAGNRLIRTAKWNGNVVNNFVISAENKKYHSPKEEFIIRAEDYVALLGIYLAEGSVNHSGITISQTKESVKNEIQLLLNRIGFKYYYSRDSFYICDYRLKHIFKQIGNNCYDKKIPNNIKSLSSNLLEILLDWMIKGDGTPIDKSDNSWEYYTTSKQLAEDVQEIALKCSRATKYRIKRTKLSTCDCYAIKIYSPKYSNVRIFKQNINSEIYNGKVYCVSTPNRTIVVRDNKKVFISGNSDLTISSFPRIGFEIYGFKSELAGFGNVLRSNWRFDVRIYGTSAEETITILDTLRQKIISARNSMYYCSYIYPGNVLDLGYYDTEKGKNKIYVKGLDVFSENNYEIN